MLVDLPNVLHTLLELEVQCPPQLLRHVDEFDGRAESSRLTHHHSVRQISIELPVAECDGQGLQLGDFVQRGLNECSRTFLELLIERESLVSLRHFRLRCFFSHGGI